MRIDEIRKPGPNDRGLFGTKRFWSGAFDTRDGHVIEVHRYADAYGNGFHHSFYFSQNAIDLMDEGDARFFWIDEQGKLQVDWRENSEVPKAILDRLMEQITIAPDGT